MQQLQTGHLEQELEKDFFFLFFCIWNMLYKKSSK